MIKCLFQRTARTVIILAQSLLGTLGNESISLLGCGVVQGRRGSAPLPLLLHLFGGVWPEASCCLLPDADQAWQAALGPGWGDDLFGGRGSTFDWVANLMLCMKRSERVSGPVIRFPLPHVCVNRPSAARLAPHPRLRLERGWYYKGVPLCQMPSVNKQGALRGGLLCIPTYPSWRTQSRCPPPSPPPWLYSRVRRKVGRVRGCCWHRQAALIHYSSLLI